MKIDDITISVETADVGGHKVPGSVSFRIEVRTTNGRKFGAMEYFPEDHFEPLFRRVVEDCARRIERLVKDEA